MKNILVCLLVLFLASVAFAADPYGYCPKCGAPGVQRERRLNGNDKCTKGHVYPSKDALPAPPRAEKPPKPQVIAYVCTMDGCPPCKRMERDIPRELVPAGWRVVVDKGSESPKASQVFISKRLPKGVRVRAYPTTIIFRDGKEVERHVGYWSAKELAAAYKAAEGR